METIYLSMDTGCRLCAHGGDSEENYEVCVSCMRLIGNNYHLDPEGFSDRFQENMLALPAGGSDERALNFLRTVGRTLDVMMMNGVCVMPPDVLFGGLFDPVPSEIIDVDFTELEHRSLAQFCAGKSPEQAMVDHGILTEQQITEHYNRKA